MSHESNTQYLRPLRSIGGARGWSCIHHTWAAQRHTYDTKAEQELLLCDVTIKVLVRQRLAMSLGCPFVKGRENNNGDNFQFQNVQSMV